MPRPAPWGLPASSARQRLGQGRGRRWAPQQREGACSGTVGGPPSGSGVGGVTGSEARATGAGSGAFASGKSGSSAGGASPERGSSLTAADSAAGRGVPGETIRAPPFGSSLRVRSISSPSSPGLGSMRSGSSSRKRVQSPWPKMARTPSTPRARKSSRIPHSMRASPLP